ncbi:YesL family protein [Brochothrix thermosphacta]|uniref:YesL family protein n=1 Tax=Brochothrix thermosphacta TaxID=2756 RepID=UPI000D11461D|nr:DUF624 domain-containing protein [Brochothrix thermosphacta]SOC29622.1 conserved membrane hypothetical protein [Brochothrix thermosphacta]
MIGEMLENVFIRCYVIIKLNLYFLLLTVMGLIVVGIGPAFLTINQLFTEHEWDYKKITWKNAWLTYKQNWKRGNALFGIYAGLSLFIGYNLYLSVQVQGILFLVIDFLLVFVLFCLFVTYSYSLVLHSRFDMGLANLIKLAFITFYSNFFMLVKLIFGIGIVLFITYKFPGLIMFATMALIQIICIFTAKQWVSIIEDKLAADGE